MTKDAVYKKLVTSRVIFPYVLSAASMLIKKKLNESSPTLRDIKTSEEKGHDAYVQDQIRKKDTDEMKISRLTKQSNRLVISITAFSLIPFHLYTDTINIEESRVTFLFRQPFTFQTHSVDIKDISNIFIESAFLFASLQVVSRTYIQNDIKIGYLWKKKADKVRKVIEGLRTFINANIDTSQYEIAELIKKIEELHASQVDVQSVHVQQVKKN